MNIYWRSAVGGGLGSASPSSVDEISTVNSGVGASLEALDSD